MFSKRGEMAEEYSSIKGESQWAIRVSLLFDIVKLYLHYYHNLYICTIINISIFLYIY